LPCNLDVVVLLGLVPDKVSKSTSAAAVSIPVKSLVPGFSVRQDGPNPHHVQSLAEVAADKLPAILVQLSGMKIIDGMHRCEAAKLRGESEIRAQVIDCTDAQALILAIRANILHGLPLSLADRKVNAKRLLVSHPNWSDRMISDLIGLSAKTVAGIRDGSEAMQADGERLGRDGRRRPMNAAGGRERAAQYINAHPEASLRQVAAAAGVSLGTAHSVRTSLHQAEGNRQSTQRGSLRSKAAVPLAWELLAARIINDPALRYAEGGREFVRWMTQHSLREGEYQGYIADIPSHWRIDISRVALAIGKEWLHFAQILKDGTWKDGV
jgi:ParB-like chromosome segregation protein Spo0J